MHDVAHGHSAQIHSLYSTLSIVLYYVYGTVVESGHLVKEAIFLEGDFNLFRPIAGASQSSL